MALSEQATQTAQYMLNQLGGRKFTAMTGAKNFVFDEKNNKLSFRLPARFANKNINYVSITLTPMDVYTVEFKKIHGMKVTDISEYENIYCDMLQELFTQETNLYLSL